MDAEDYYSSECSICVLQYCLVTLLYQTAGWFTNNVDADKTLQLFFDGCVEAGPTVCPFYAPDPADIRRNLTALYERVEREPVAVSADGFYGIVDLTALRSVVFLSLYSPYSSFGPLATGLAQLAAGNGTVIFGAVIPPAEPYECPSDPHAHDFDEVPEGRATLACNDGDALPGSLAATQEHWERLAEVSDFADIWGHVPTDCV